MYIIVDGALEARVDTKDHGAERQETSVGTLTAGEVVGEVQLVAGGTRAATVVSVMPTALLVLQANTSRR